MFIYVKTSGLQENSTQLLKKLRKFSTGVLRLKKVFSVYVCKIRFICVQNIMYAVLATL